MIIIIIIIIIVIIIIIIIIIVAKSTSYRYQIVRGTIITTPKMEMIIIIRKNVSMIDKCTGIYCRTDKLYFYST